jgi:hypothetical protein
MITDAATCDHWLALQMTLSELGFFEHGRSCTLWCDPQSQGEGRWQSSEGSPRWLDH